MARVHNLSKWKKLNPGGDIVLPGEGGRTVRVDFNVILPTPVHLIRGRGDDAKLIFVGLVEKLDFVEFTAPEGEIRLVCDSDEPVWFFTNDGVVVANDVSEQEHWTKIMTREQRNPQQDLIMWQMQQNAKRREQALQAEILRMQEREAEREAQAQADAAAASAAATAAAAEEVAAAAAKAAKEAADKAAGA